MVISGDHVHTLYDDVLHWAKVHPGLKQGSRVGQVLRLPAPLMLVHKTPRHRVLIDPARNANPFFHLMEFIWMCAGSNEGWITRFNKQMEQYMEKSEGGDYFYAAYGWRWRHHFDEDQIASAISMLRRDHTTRRVYVGIWDPKYDLRANAADLPCNVGFALQYDIDDRLDMFVFNRSNDLIWGLLGSNVVHFTMLHEVICNCLRADEGRVVFTTVNPHIYERHWGLLENPAAPVHHFDPRPLAAESWDAWVEDCEHFLDEGPSGRYYHMFFKDVAIPMYRAYIDKDEGQLHHILASDWREACKFWWRQNRAS